MTVPLGVVEAGLTATSAQQATVQARTANAVAREPAPFHCYYCAANAKAAAAGCSACVCTTDDIGDRNCEWGGCPARIEAGRAAFNRSMRTHYGMPTFQELIQ